MKGTWRPRDTSSVKKLRAFLDEAIGHAALGDPIRTQDEVARELGITRGGVFMTERNALRKVGRFVREMDW